MQTKQQHTPGDWRYAPELSAVVVVRNHEVKVVADFGKTDLPEREANALLIESAPAMLSALEDVHARLLKMWQSDHSGPLYDAIHAVRAAITKARGEA